MSNAEVIQQARDAARQLTYNDGKVQSLAKHLLLDMAGRLERADAAEKARQAEEPAAFMYPSALAEFRQRETHADAFSVSVTNVDTLECTVGLYLRA